MMLGQLLNRESLRNLIVAMEIENRPIYGVTITKDTGNPDENTNKAYKDELLLERVFKPEMYLLPIATDEIRKNDGKLYGRDPEK